MESMGSGWPEPVAMEFPTNSTEESPSRVPRRIRRRLLEAKSSSSPSSVEAIEAKLREADRRREVNLLALDASFLGVFLYFTGIRLDLGLGFSVLFEINKHFAHIKNWNLVWSWTCLSLVRC